jgi:ribosomal protein S18 acetylase RimI-like enzyme
MEGGMDVTVTQQEDNGADRGLLEALTARLPQWFGQADSNRHYAEQAETLESWVARLGGNPVGLLLLKRHSFSSAEIYWLGVDPDHHRRGIGRALVSAVERQVKDKKVRFLFVMTLHPDVDYEPYRRTRLFYESLGFELALSTRQGPTGPSSDALAYYLKVL